MEDPGHVTLVVEDQQGRRVRNLIQDEFFEAGEHTVLWDGYDEGDLSYRIKPDDFEKNYKNLTRRRVEQGVYNVRGLVHSGILQRYEFSVNSKTPGSPPWHSAVGSGGFMGDHSENYDVTYLPNGSPYGDQPQILVAGFVVEQGHSLSWLDAKTGKKLFGRKLGGNFGQVLSTAIDQGDKPLDKYHIYALRAWTPHKKHPEAKQPYAGITVWGLAPDGHYDELLVRDFPGSAGGRYNASDLAVWNGRVIFSATFLGELIFVDGRAGNRNTEILAQVAVPEPRGLTFDAQGRLLVVCSNSLKRFTVDWQNNRLIDEETLVAEIIDEDGYAPAPDYITGEDKPQHIDTDPQGNIYVSCMYPLHQVKVYDSAGKFVRTIGKPGGPQVGDYDEQRMHYPRGVAVTDDGELWVAERDFAPKRISRWKTDGEFEMAIYGSPKYGSGGTIDPQDRSIFYYTYGQSVMQFRLDWTTGASRLEKILLRQAVHHWGAGSGLHDEPGGPVTQYAEMPKSQGRGIAVPDRALYVEGRRYMTNNWCRGSYDNRGPLFVWMDDENGLLRPVLAIGRLGVTNFRRGVHQANWDILEQEPYKSLWYDKYIANQVAYVWVDQNADGYTQPEEFQFLYRTRAKPEDWPHPISKLLDQEFAKSLGRLRDHENWPWFGAEQFGPWTLQPDLSLTDAYGHYVPVTIDAKGIPQPQLDAMRKLVDVESDYILGAGTSQMAFPMFDRNTHIAMGCPIVGYDLTNGREKWRYNVFGAGWDSWGPTPEFAGQIIAMRRTLGPIFTPEVGEAGPVFGLNGYYSQMFLVTADGLYLATLGGDSRVNSPLRANVEERGMILNGLSYGSEHFWPNITQVSGRGVYLVAGKEYSGIQKLEGFETVRRIKPFSIKVTSDMLLGKPGTSDVALFGQRTGRFGTGGGEKKEGVLALRESAPVVDGKLDDWRGMDWLPIEERRGIFAAVAVHDGVLYAAYRTGKHDLLANSAPSPHMLFASGGALDIGIGTLAGADQSRRGGHGSVRKQHPLPGDVRLVVTRKGDAENGPIAAALYEQSSNEESVKARDFAKEWKKVDYESPIGEVTVDIVRDVSDMVRLAQDGGDFEFSVPISVLGLKAEPRREVLADIGVIIGDGIDANGRLYWSNTSSTMASDLPSEAEFAVNDWGVWKIDGRNKDSAAKLPGEGLEQTDRGEAIVAEPANIGAIPAFAPGK